MVADGGAPSGGDEPPERESKRDGGSTSDGEPTDRGTADDRPTGDDDWAPGDDDRSTGDDRPDRPPTDEEVVAAAAEAAEGVVFSRYRRSDVRDVDVAVTFEDGLLEVDVYLNVPDADAEEHVDEEAERVADDAALAAIDAVDRLFEERGA